MPEVIFNGPEGRLEGRYHHSATPGAPIALVLHPNPRHGGTMNNRVVYSMYQAFINQGFSVLRFNFRGVGRSQGAYDHGHGELSDAASAMDWMQTYNTAPQACWIAGFSFGGWIAMQLMMRRPEIDGFIAAAPPANLYDFSFLAPCPASGMIIHGDADEFAPKSFVDALAERLRLQKTVKIDYRNIPGADHFFAGKTDVLTGHMEDYLQQRMKAAAA
ncbi:MAG: alpha/beta hydrolase [Rhodospirillales bacterium]